MKPSSIQIGKLALRNNLIAAPMAGLSTLPYRMLAMEFGCALAISEMVSAEGSIRARDKTRRYFTNDARVRPFGVQVFGAKPDRIAEAIKRFADEPIDLIDINMGCPVKKVCSKGAGAALMRDPKLAANIMKEARRATVLPLTVKIRAGWDDASINCVEMARIAEDAGVDAIAVHGRTKKQEFRGKADWRHIADAKAAVGIPVIGNGDVKTREDAVHMLEETGCDGVMIGRAAVGNPWIFKTISDPNYAGPSAAERGVTAIRHLDMLEEFVGERYAILSMRAILPWYAKGMPGVKAFLREAQAIADIEVLRRKIESFFSSL